MSQPDSANPPLIPLDRQYVLLLGDKTESDPVSAQAIKNGLVAKPAIFWENSVIKIAGAKDWSLIKDLPEFKDWTRGPKPLNENYWATVKRTMVILAIPALIIVVLLARGTDDNGEKTAVKAGEIISIDEQNMPADPGNRQIFGVMGNITQIISPGRALFQYGGQLYLLAGIPRNLVDDDVWQGAVFQGDNFTYETALGGTKTVRSLIVSTRTGR